MPLFLCRWPNGDCSVVLARTKADAIVELDQRDVARRDSVCRERRADGVLFGGVRKRDGAEVSTSSLHR